MNVPVTPLNPISLKSINKSAASKFCTSSEKSKSNLSDVFVFDGDDGVEVIDSVGGIPSVATVPVKPVKVFPAVSSTPPTCAIVGATPVPNGVVYVRVTTLPDTPIVPSVLKSVVSEV